MNSLCTMGSDIRKLKASIWMSFLKFSALTKTKLTALYLLSLNIWCICGKIPLELHSNLIDLHTPNQESLSNPILTFLIHCTISLWPPVSLQAFMALTSIITFKFIDLKLQKWLIPLSPPLPCAFPPCIPLLSKLQNLIFTNFDISWSAVISFRFSFTSTNTAQI